MSGSLEMAKQAMPDEEKSGACDMVIQVGVSNCCPLGIKIVFYDN